MRPLRRSEGEADTGAEATREALSSRGEEHGEFDGRPGFDGHHDFGERPDFHRGRGDSFFFGDPYYGAYPAPDDSVAPGYRYYCPSYGDYSPNVESCPELWIPEPAS